MRITPPIKPIRAEVRLPASKSMANRALLLQALSKGKIQVENIPDSDDVRLMQQALDERGEEVYCGAAGTVARFYLAYACTQNRRVRLSGSERLNQRPIAPLVEALQQLGFRLSYVDREGYLPIQVEPGRNEISDPQVQIQADVSSQFISALMMWACSQLEELNIKLDGPITSRPYLALTAMMMADSGITTHLGNDFVLVKPAPFKEVTLQVEPDWSAAGYWYQLAALNPGSEIFLANLPLRSPQGDSRIAQLFEPLGVLTEVHKDGLLIRSDTPTTNFFTYDFSEIPDQAQTVMATLAGLGISGQLTGLHTLPHKETDRIKAMQNELKKIGCALHDEGQTLRVEPHVLPPDEEPVFETYSDHRMAMSLAPLSLRFGEVTIRHPEVVSKSYPDFWDDLKSAGFMLES